MGGSNTKEPEPEPAKSTDKNEVITAPSTEDDKKSTSNLPNPARQRQTATQASPQTSSIQDPLGATGTKAPQTQVTLKTGGPSINQSDITDTGIRHRNSDNLRARSCDEGLSQATASLSSYPKAEKPSKAHEIEEAVELVEEMQLTSTEHQQKSRPKTTERIPSHNGDQMASKDVTSHLKAQQVSNPVSQDQAQLTRRMQIDAILDKALAQRRTQEGTEAASSDRPQFRIADTPKPDIQRSQHRPGQDLQGSVKAKVPVKVSRSVTRQPGASQKDAVSSSLVSAQRREPACKSQENEPEKQVRQPTSMLRASKRVNTEENGMEVASSDHPRFRRADTPTGIQPGGSSGSQPTTAHSKTSNLSPCDTLTDDALKVKKILHEKPPTSVVCTDHKNEKKTLELHPSGREESSAVQSKGDSHHRVSVKESRSSSIKDLHELSSLHLRTSNSDEVSKGQKVVAGVSKSSPVICKSDIPSSQSRTLKEESNSLLENKPDSMSTDKHAIINKRTLPQSKKDVQKLPTDHEGFDARPVQKTDKSTDHLWESAFQDNVSALSCTKSIDGAERSKSKQPVPSIRVSGTYNVEMRYPPTVLKDEAPLPSKDKHVSVEYTRVDKKGSLVDKPDQKASSNDKCPDNSALKEIQSIRPKDKFIGRISPDAVICKANVDVPSTTYKAPTHNSEQKTGPVTGELKKAPQGIQTAPDELIKVMSQMKINRSSVEVVVGDTPTKKKGDHDIDGVRVPTLQDGLATASGEVRNTGSESFGGARPKAKVVERKSLDGTLSKSQSDELSSTNWTSKGDQKTSPQSIPPKMKPKKESLVNEVEMKLKNIKCLSQQERSRPDVDLIGKEVLLKQKDDEGTGDVKTVPFQTKVESLRSTEGKKSDLMAPRSTAAICKSESVSPAPTIKSSRVESNAKPDDRPGSLPLDTLSSEDTSESDEDFDLSNEKKTLEAGKEDLPILKNVQGTDDLHPSVLKDPARWGGARPKDRSIEKKSPDDDQPVRKRKRRRRTAKKSQDESASSDTLPDHVTWMMKHEINTEETHQGRADNSRIFTPEHRGENKQKENHSKSTDSKVNDLNPLEKSTKMAPSNKQRNNMPAKKHPEKYTESWASGPQSGQMGRHHRQLLTYVTVDLPDVILNTHLESYFEYVLERSFNYDIETTCNTISPEQQTEGNSVLLQFQSDREANEFVQCMRQEGQGSGIRTFVGRSDNFPKEKVFPTMHKKTRIPIANHEEKINALEKQLKDRKTNKPMSLEEYGRVVDEMKALESKLTELRLQLDEFRKYMDKLKPDVERLEMRKDEAKLISKRREFGAELRRFKTGLPMYARKTDIIRTVRDNQVCVVLGETGSGKSTQMVQYLYTAGMAKSGHIVCTQPRKVAAISLAERVSEELSVNVGQEVGYKVGMKTKTSKNTSILFMTDHMLLKSCAADPLFKEYSCIVIDEAHERSIQTDLLLGMLKKCLPKRPDLKVVITSATIDPQVFVRYFGGCPVLKVSGRMFPVDVTYNDFENPFQEYVEEAVMKANELHETEPKGDILVFLTSGLETEKAMKRLQSMVSVPNSVTILQLHGRQQADEQKQAFAPTHPEKRKIVFATNCAETSITIPGIKYVIDTGMVKAASYDHKKNMHVLAVQRINKSSAEQRKGRAGRTECGKCYRLFSRQEYEDMEKEAKPEILCCHLGSALLQLLQLDMCVYDEFDFVESPPKEALDNAMSMLNLLGACKDGKVTELGLQLAKLSIEPRLGKMLLLGVQQGLGYECLVLAAVCTVGGSIFFRAGSEEEKRKADKKKLRFCEESGDLLTLLAVYKEWSSVKNQTGWCVENSINAKSMRISKENLKELQQTLQKDLKMKVDTKFRTDENVTAQLIKIILQCNLANLSFFSGHRDAGFFLASSPNMTLHLHPSSSLRVVEELPRWVVFENILTTSKTFMMNVTAMNEDETLQVIEEAGLAVDHELLKSLSLQVTKFRGIGNETMQKIVGPRFSSIKKLQEDIVQRFQKGIEIEPIRDDGLLLLYCQPSVSDKVSSIVENYIEDIKDSLWTETSEQAIEVNSGTRVILQRGCLVADVLLPKEFRKVMVKNVPEDVDKSVIHDCLQEFGEIVDIFEFKSNRTWNKGNGVRWGKVTFCDAASAQRAIEGLEDADFEIQPDVSYRDADKDVEYKITVQLVRRPGRGIGFVTFEDPEDAPLACACLSDFCLDDIHISVSLNKKDPSQLFLRNLPRNIEEDYLKRCLESYLDENIRIERLSIPRENVPTTGKSDLDMYRRRLIGILTNAHVLPAEYEIRILPVKEKTAFFRALIFIHDASTLDTVRMELQEHTINGYPLSILSQYQVGLNIPRDIYEIIETPLHWVTDALCLKFTVEFNCKELRSGHRVLDVATPDANTLAVIKDKLNRVIKGTSMELSDDKLKYILSPSGQKLLTKLQKKKTLLIKTDFRLCQLTMFGKRIDIENAQTALENFLTEATGYKSTEIPLKGEGLPKGLMKQLVVDFGSELRGLQDRCEALLLDLNLRKHTLIFQGTPESLEELKVIMNEMKDKMKTPKQSGLSDGTPDCLICLCAIEDGKYILEICGHAYCKSCAILQIQNAIRSKEFPIKCASDGCEECLVLADARSLLGRQDTNLQALTQSALDAFMQTNREHYQYCPTANCPSIYRISSQNEVFKCPECREKICTTCRKPSHNGLSCAQLRSMENDPDYNLKQWVADDPSNRTLCPKCDTPIEKTEGCNHMLCLACKIHMCWLCKETFQSEQTCYAHLQKKHGGFF